MVSTENWKRALCGKYTYLLKKHGKKKCFFLDYTLSNNDCTQLTNAVLLVTYPHVQRYSTVLKLLSDKNLSNNLLLAITLRQRIANKNHRKSS